MCSSDLTFLDEDGVERFYAMGCYGIGISRIMATAAEQFHDGAGLRWPKALAPFHVCVILANQDHEPARAEAERVYTDLRDRGVEVVLDDREERAGVKFNDADLVGYPVQVVVGRRGIEAGTAELKLRSSGERRTVPLGDVVEASIELLTVAP